MKRCVRSIIWFVRVKRYMSGSQYPLAQAREAVNHNDLGTPCIIHQPRFSMFRRGVEERLLDFLQTEGIGSIAFHRWPVGNLPTAISAAFGRLARRQQQSFLQPELQPD